MFGHNTEAAAKAINALGLELLGKAARPDANTLFSPYSIQCALAMAWGGAAGQTRSEMGDVLHYPKDEAAVHQSFAALQKALTQMTEESAARVKEYEEWFGPSDPVTLTVANRLFGQEGYQFRDTFLALLRETYDAPLEPLDFIRNPGAAIERINSWVEERTRRRIRDLVPEDSLGADARLVLVNAIYLKASWETKFSASNTRPRPFYVLGEQVEDVSTMEQEFRCGFLKRDGYSAVTIPYAGGDIRFLVILPDEVNGLRAIEAGLTPDQLSTLAQAPTRDVVLYLPKFKVQPPLFGLGRALRDLGMKTAFDDPKGSADFDRMAPRRPDDYLCISEVFHKTFIEVDEHGTEAAAATAIMVAVAGLAEVEPPKPIEVKVDRPFLFAIQHRASGACLFLGRVTDPR